MRFSFFVLILLQLNFCWAQTKKEQIQYLVSKCDSLDSLMSFEKILFIKNYNNLEQDIDSLTFLILSKQNELNNLKITSSDIKTEHVNYQKLYNELTEDINQNKKKIEAIDISINQIKDSLNKTKFIKVSNQNLSFSNIELETLENTNTENFFKDNIKNCEIDTSRFNDKLYPPIESDFVSLDDNFDSNLIKVHVSKLKHKNGNILEYDNEEIWIYTADEIIYFDGQPFNGIAFTQNDYYLDGKWRKKGIYSQFKNGVMKGKTVKYFNNGGIYQISDSEKNLLKRYNTKGELILLEEYKLFSNGALIEYFDNGNLRQKQYFIVFDNDINRTNRFPTEEYNINGELLEKTVYHCDKWPLVKYMMNRNDTHSKGYYTEYEKWIKEVEPFLHKYTYSKTITKSNSTCEKGVFYRYIDENGDIKGNVLPIFKDGIWEYGVIGESEKTISIEYSAKLAIDQCKNKNGENEIKNGIYLKKEKNGQVIVSGQYDNNNMDGVWKYYYKNGTLRCSVNYKKGLLSGKFSYYDNTGRVLIEGQYNDSKVNNNGWQRSLNYELDRIVFDENSVFNFPIEGLEGSYLYNFYGNGKSTKETYTYSNGQLLGPYEIYENGVLKEKGIKP